MNYQDPQTSAVIELAPDVIALLSAHKQWGFLSRERGGLLFLRHEPQDRIYVSQATAPHKRDKSTRTSLVLDPKRCSDEIRSANERELWFVGYWHTHPERLPRISSHDLIAFENCLASPAVGISAMLAVIVGSSGAPEEFSAYLIGNKKVTELDKLREWLPKEKAGRSNCVDL